LPQLVNRFEQMGGVANIFLTHRDDVAEAHKYAARFASRRIIHQLELASQPDAEMVIDGNADVRISEKFVCIPTPGHTRGHCCLLYDDRFLFTGDHLWWSRERKHLNASRDVCWYSWSDQRRSIERLADLRFEWVLPGHGERVWLASDEMRRQIEELAGRM
jgi:glyoxylase-like metal-dependent hydrolase (beta-lactamase superfamily II)